MIVFDASGSMAGMGFGEKSITRIEQVRRALAEVVPAIAPLRNLGLVVFGPGARPVCENVDPRFPPGPNRGERIMAEVHRLQPYGQTPLRRAEATHASLRTGSGARGST
jgi:Ca-activated chloride channel family protein